MARKNLGEPWRVMTKAASVYEVMTPKERRFMDAMHEGKECLECVAISGFKQAPRLAKKYYTYMSAKMRHYEKLIIADASKRAEENAVMSTMERRKFLADVVRTPLGKLDENSPLVQEKTSIVTKDGGEIVKLRGCDKLTAVELDSKLAGDISNGGTNVQVGINLEGLLGKLPDTSRLPDAKRRPQRTLVEVSEAE